LKNAEDIQDQLGDQLTLVIMMKSSPFINPVRRRATDLENRIGLAQDALEEWLKC
jgi:dynein heavy chain